MMVGRIRRAASPSGMNARHCLMVRRFKAYDPTGNPWRRI
ncbi:hypothetical protein A628_01111 [Salmonella enterica subsp. enterica serovar Cubana str. 76814]|uniref:Uncharacterized protein n=2 Tax=Salmonella enterica I TaxID=59201 RepID=V7IRQ9_SALET|nr:hypothetical protein A628_01111 [Salmonella enterica subsp. enterica serovar Cubana str. 76814]